MTVDERQRRKDDVAVKTSLAITSVLRLCTKDISWGYQ